MPDSITHQSISSRSKNLGDLSLDQDDVNIEHSSQAPWWWASTAIPLLAATTGPLANVLSIAALVTSWRNDFDPDSPGVDADSIGFPDPKWCLVLNGASLACGFVGNLFLLFNFTRRVRYIIALPMTIILWYFATGILVAITVAMNRYVPPHRPEQTYSQGYWHAVIAAILYLVSSMALMLNMLGYFLGHYPQHFELNDEQRNLILQTMMFFIWLAGGAGVFTRLEGWSYADALYFCDTTILTVGFGDFHPSTDAARGLVFPYSIGGIVILGLMVTSIAKFAKDLGASHVVRGHVERRRNKAIEQSASSERELSELQDQPHIDSRRSRPADRSATLSEESNLGLGKSSDKDAVHKTTSMRSLDPIRRTISKQIRRVTRRPNKLQLLKEEKDRFDAMRAIQQSTVNFKNYSALATSVIAFGILWCVGAVGFWRVEQHTQNLSYFEALYFCYISLLTIGYGDLAPTSNAGKPLFVVWSLIAVPTMTILISDMGKTVVASFRRGTFALADWTVLPREGVWAELIANHPVLFGWLLKWQRRNNATNVEGSPPLTNGPTLEDVLLLDSLSHRELGQHLSRTIRRVCANVLTSPPKRYQYEEWAEITRLIRFTRYDTETLTNEESEEGLIEWDWIGEDSPMLANKSESEWILDRLCESLERFLRQHDVTIIPP